MPQVYRIICLRMRSFSSSGSISQSSLQLPGLEAPCHSILTPFLRHKEPICGACARSCAYMALAFMMPSFVAHGTSREEPLDSAPGAMLRTNAGPTQCEHWNPSLLDSCVRTTAIACHTCAPTDDVLPEMRGRRGYIMGQSR